MARSLPALIRFQREHPNDERFMILAFHDRRVKSFEEYEEKVAAVRERYWDGEQLPFPVLLDATDRTVRRQYRVQGFPTTLLFDPRGRLVGWGTVELLEQALRGEVETPRPRGKRR